MITAIRLWCNFLCLTSATHATVVVAVMVNNTVLVTADIESELLVACEADWRMCQVFSEPERLTLATFFTNEIE